MSDKHLSPYLNEFEDIPGTLVFNTFRSRQGFNLNQFCMSLMKPENREKFKANEVGVPQALETHRGADRRGPAA